MKIIDDYKVPPCESKEIISVVVAIYNIENYIEKCVRSIMAQTYPNLEIILVDDGATDRSGEICEALAAQDSRIQVLHKQNGGLSDARNAGITIATGSYIAFVDGDDWIESSMYESMLGSIIEQKADLAVCRYRNVYKDEIQDGATGKAVVFEGKEALRNFLEEDERYLIQNAAWNKLYRLTLIKDQRFPVGKWYEDIVYTTLLLSKINKCVYLDIGFYNYVADRDGSIMNNGVNPRILSHQIPAYFEKKAVLEKLGDEELVGIHEYYFYKRLLLYYSAIRKSKSKEKKQQLKQLMEWIREAKDYQYRMYHWEGAKNSDKKKLDIFLFSPTLYYYTILLNEAILIPIKEKRKRKLNV